MLPNINKLLTGKSEVISEFNNPHSAKPASMPSSFLRITYYWMDYLLGYWINLRGQIIKGRTIIFDRYFYDFIVDPRRSRLSLPGWIVGLYLTLTPKPDLIFFLDANADQIFNLAMIQGPFVALLMIIPFGIFSFYSIDRQTHQKILSQLEAR